MYHSRRGRTFVNPYPYVRFSKFSEFDIQEVKNKLEISKSKGTILGSFQADMEYLAFVYAREGSSLKKITKKKARRLSNNRIQGELKTLLDLSMHYCIVEKPVSATDITLWRLGALYCREVSSFFHKCKIKPFLSQEQLGLSETGGFPLAMMHLSFGQLIPSTRVTCAEQNEGESKVSPDMPGDQVNQTQNSVAGDIVNLNLEYNTPVHPFHRTELVELNHDPETTLGLISPEDYECLYYGYAYHQKIFYQTLTSTTKGNCPKNRKTLKAPRDILNYIDEQIAYPIMNDQEKLEFLEKLNILVKCDYQENEGSSQRITYYLESRAKFALKKCKDLWSNSSGEHNDDRGGVVLFELVRFPF